MRLLIKACRNSRLPKVRLFSAASYLRGMMLPPPTQGLRSTTFFASSASCARSISSAGTSNTSSEVTEAGGAGLAGAGLMGGCLTGGVLTAACCIAACSGRGKGSARQIRLEKSVDFLERLNSRRRARKPMVIARKLDQYYRFAACAKCVRHVVGLLGRHHGVVRGVNQ
jgi:hypothetical protein